MIFELVGYIGICQACQLMEFFFLYDLIGIKSGADEHQAVRKEFRLVVGPDGKTVERDIGLNAAGYFFDPAYPVTFLVKQTEENAFQLLFLPVPVLIAILIPVEN